MAISSVLGSSALAPAGLGFRNMLINGNMIVDQRNGGSSIAVTGASFPVDRWRINTSAFSYLNAGQNYNGLTPPPGFSKYLGIKTSSAYSIASGSYFYLNQAIEGTNIGQLSWGTANAKPVTLSFWVNASITGTYGGSLQASSTRSYVFSYTVNNANTWEYKTIQIYGDTTGTWATDNTAGLYVCFGLGVGSTYSGSTGSWGATNNLSVTGAVSVVGTLNATWNITGVQLEQNVVPTPFEQRPIGVELALCQRYYCYMDYNTGGQNFVDGYQGSTGYITCWLKFPQTMRIKPSSVSLNIGGYSNTSGWTASPLSPDYFQINAYTPGGRAYYYINNVSGSAEL